MQSVRPAAVAGMFYPSDATELRDQVQGFLRSAKPSHHTPKAIIAPHAGYVYSGAIAGSAYAALQDLTADIENVVLLGPCHREYVSGIAASSAATFNTPLGGVKLDQAAIRALVDEFEFVEYSDSAHALEHSLEVQLPFLQSIFSGFRLLPFAVGGATPEQVEMLLERVWFDVSTMVVVSSDLSHYHDYTNAQQIDQYTTQKIERLDPAGLSGEHACGQRPICGLLRYAAKHGLKCEVVDVRNSGDTAGMRDRVVGYGAYLFHD